jgi:hypothetical protein
MESSIMGHIRLGELPRTRKWDQVVALIAGGAHAPQVANATIRAAQSIFSRAIHDQGLVETLWLLFRLPMAARAADFTEALRECGLEITAAPGLMEVLAAFTGAVDARLFNNRGRTDLGEMAQMAAVETLADVLGPRTQSLFGTAAEDVRRSLAGLATPGQIGSLGRRFFARLVYKFLDFYLSRTLADHVGEGHRFATLAQVALFSQALETHCTEAAFIVEAFSGDWFALHRWETGGDITRELAANFAHGAMRKLTDELKQGAQGARSHG